MHKILQSLKDAVNAAAATLELRLLSRSADKGELTLTAADGRDIASHFEYRTNARTILRFGGVTLTGNCTDDVAVAVGQLRTSTKGSIAFAETSTREVCIGGSG